MKTYLFRIVLFVTITFSFSALSKAQTLHAIVFCNTIDESIGESMKVDFSNMRNQLNILVGAIEYDKDFTFLDGPTCTRDNLKLIIDQMDVEEDDVILTFYSGHGSHAPNNETDPWPQYCMNTGFENQGNWVPMASLAKWVMEKTPRLSIILSNCCNSIQRGTTAKPLWAMGGDYSVLDERKAENLKKLFSAKGLVMATSSKLDEYSWCGSMGGLFTNDFVQALDMVGSGKLSPDWGALLKKAEDLCVAHDIIHDGTRYKQHPYYKIDSNPGSMPRGVDNPKSNDPLDQMLIDLLAKDRTTRLSVIPSMLGSNHFGKYREILTVGTDLETVVEHEKPNDFLRRISLSPYIKQVNIIREESGDLIVHEVRIK